MLLPMMNLLFINLVYVLIIIVKLNIDLLFVVW
jgi:hypothetical protein